MAVIAGSRSLPDFRPWTEAMVDWTTLAVDKIGELGEYRSTDLAALKNARNALLNARAQGVRNTAYKANGVERSIEWRSDMELKAALADIEARIATLDGNGLPRHVQIRCVKGY